MYGYELVHAIKRATGNQLLFGEGCIYPILHRLERDDLLSSYQNSVRGRSRITYRLTTKGHRQLASTASVWKEVVSAVNRVLQGGADAQPSMA
jgi:PadR family transcriptional regulator PadR